MEDTHVNSKTSKIPASVGNILEINSLTVDLCSCDLLLNKDELAYKKTQNRKALFGVFAKYYTFGARNTLCNLMSQSCEILKSFGSMIYNYGTF